MAEFIPDVLMVGSPFQKGDGVFDSAQHYKMHYIDAGTDPFTALESGHFRLIVIWARKDSYVAFMTSVRQRTRGIPVIVVAASSLAAFFLESGAADFVDEAAPTAVLVRRIEVMLGIFNSRSALSGYREIKAPLDPLQESLEEAAAIAVVSNVPSENEYFGAHVARTGTLKEIIETLEQHWMTSGEASSGRSAVDALESVDLQGYIDPKEQVEEHSPVTDSVLSDEVPSPEITSAPAEPAVASLDTIARRIVRLNTHSADESATVLIPTSDEKPVSAPDLSSAPTRSYRVRTRRVQTEPSRSPDLEQAARDSVPKELREEPPSVPEPVADSVPVVQMEENTDTFSALSRQVEARSSLDTGEIRTTRVWAILARLLETRFTGQVVFENRSIQRTVSFENGEPLLVISSAREDRLIELLYREGRLTETQYESASLTIGASGRRAGVVLVEKGLIASRELFPLVRYHYESLLFDLLTWEDGHWRLEPNSEAPTERILLDTPAATIIVEGIRSRATEAMLSLLVPPDAAPLRTDGIGIGGLASTGLSARELEILDWCDGVRTVAQLATRFSMEIHDLRACLAGLVALRWISVSGESGTYSSVAASESAVEKNQAPAPLQAADIQVERTRVLDKMAQVREASYFAILEVPESATAYEIRKAYRRLKGLFSPERFSAAEVKDLQKEIEVIGNVLDEAHEVLRGDEMRDAYRAAGG